MSSEKIVSSYGFDNDSLIVSFAEIIVIHIEEAEDVQLNEDFQTDEKVYQLAIKQKGANKNTVTLVAESVIKDFKSAYTKYLDHRVNIAANEDLVVSQLLNNADSFFERMEKKLESTLNTIIEKADMEIEKIVADSSTILEDNRTYNKEISKELECLKSLKSVIEDFVLESDEVLTGELMEEEQEVS